MSTPHIHTDAPLLNFLTGGDIPLLTFLTGGGLSGVDTSGVVDGDALCRFASSRFRIGQNLFAPSIIAGVGFHSGVGVWLLEFRSSELP